MREDCPRGLVAVAGRVVRHGPPGTSARLTTNGVGKEGGEGEGEGSRRKVEGTVEWLVRYFEYKHSQGGVRRWLLRFDWTLRRRRG